MTPDLQIALLQDVLGQRPISQDAQGDAQQLGVGQAIEPCEGGFVAARDVREQLQKDCSAVLLSGRGSAASRSPWFPQLDFSSTRPRIASVGGGRMSPIRNAGAKSFGGGASAMIFRGRPNRLV
jgi:hypothetical protein